MSIRTLRHLPVVAVVIATALFGGGTAGGPLPVAAQGEQVVVEFGAGKVLNPGECTIVEWFVEMAGDWLVTLDDEPVESRGHREVCPQVTTTYTLQVEAPGGPISKQATVVVGEGLAGDAVTPGEEPQPGGEGPPIFFKVVEPEAIPRGTCAKLAWEVGVGTDSTVSINEQELPPAAVVEICPQETSRYELVVKHPGGVSTREISLTVMDTLGAGVPEREAAPPEVEGAPGGEPGEASVAFAALPETIAQGACAVLHWSVTPAEGWAVLLDGQRVASPWEQEVCPQTTTTYRLAVEAPTETINRSVTVTVVQEPAAGPGPTTAPPAQPPPPPPAGQPPSAPSGADVRPSDLFIESGALITRITNDGPDILTDKKVQVTISGCGAGKEHTLNLAPGETRTMDTYCPPATGQNSYTVSVKALDFTDPNGGNNSYTETLDGGSASPPVPPGGSSGDASPPMPPGGSSAGILTADLAVTDLYPDNHPQGGMMVRFTNRGPDSMSDINVPVSCQVIAHFISAQTNPLTFSKDFTANVTLNKGQTSAHYTRIDLDTGLYWYEGKCTISPSWKDDRTDNNSYEETIKVPGP